MAEKWNCIEKYRGIISLEKKVGGTRKTEETEGLSTLIDFFVC